MISTSEAKSIALRKLSHESAAHYRLAARRRRPIRFVWLEEQWQLAISRLAEPRYELMSFAADWGGAMLVIHADRSALARVGWHVLGTDIEPLLDGDLRAVVIEAAFAQLADCIESSTRKRFKLIDAAPEESSPREWFQFRLDDGHQNVTVDVGFDQGGLGLFAEAVRRLPPDGGDIHAWSGLPVSVRFTVGMADLPIKTFDDLKRRDVVILDESWIGPKAETIVVHFGQRYAASGVLSGRTITLTEALEEIMAEDDELLINNSEGLAKLSVRLTFDLGERSIPLGEMMQLGPGHVFDLGREVRKAVTIRANGRPIGEGEIVDVDGRIGVVILRLEPAA